MTSRLTMTTPAARVGVAIALACALLMVVASAPGPVGAVACVVSVTTDGSPAPAGSLREKVEDPSCDSITFSVPNGSTIVLTNGELVITRNLTITGPGATNLTVSGNDTSRVFRINDGAVAISLLTVAHGNATAASGTFNGGGIIIYTAGSLN